MEWNKAILKQSGIRGLVADVMKTVKATVQGDCQGYPTRWLSKKAAVCGSKCL